MDSSIVIMQLFSGLSLVSVLLLVAMGLAIIFGLMGVINMAHGEFMAIGAYTTYLVSRYVSEHHPNLFPYYMFFSLVVAFFIAGLVGMFVEWAMVRHLYKRPLDTLLATWGLSLVMQQLFKTIFGAEEKSVDMPDWLYGSWKPTEAIDIPLNGIFVLGLSVLVASLVFLVLRKTRWGLRVRAVTQNRVMSGAVGINTRRVDRMTFAVGCGIAGVAGCAFTMIGSTSPQAGQSYIVDSFLVVVFGGVQSLLGTIASAFLIGEAQSSAEFFADMSGSMAKVATLLTVVIILMFRPAGLFASKVRK